MLHATLLALTCYQRSRYDVYDVSLVHLSLSQYHRIDAASQITLWTSYEPLVFQRTIVWLRLIITCFANLSGESIRIHSESTAGSSRRNLESDFFFCTQS